MGAPIEPVEITAGAVHLRPWRPADAAAVLEICQDPEIARWTTVPAPYTAEHARRFVEEQVPAGWAQGTSAIWAVCEATSGQVQASVGLHLDRGGDSAVAELGFWCARPARGRGVVTAAARAACRWGFAALGLRRIEWDAQVGNEASWRVAHQVGFRFEGTARARLRSPRGVADGWVGGLLPGQVADHRVPLPFGPDPELAGGPVSVRRWREADVPGYAAARPDAAAGGTCPAPGGGGTQHAGTPVEPAWLEICVAAVEGWMTGRAACLALCLDGAVAGGFELRPRGHRLAEVGWWWGADLPGTGPAGRAADRTGALRLATGWAAELGWRRLEVRVPAGDRDALDLAAGAGFAAEATLRGPRAGDRTVLLAAVR